jgi:UDP-N-acetylmuramoyl-L-alanyl-D-glutamate--2,6-diaminopimelate ligase
VGEERVEPKEIAQLLEGIATGGRGRSVSVTGVVYDSREVAEGDAFFCVPGFAHDGHRFAADAASRGAAALVVERLIDEVADTPQFLVDDTRVALAIAANRFYDEPSTKMNVIGVTGTNGKTTTTYLTDAIMRAAGETTGLIGTVETRIGSERLDAGRTTPESADIQALFARMLGAGISSVAMEVSSHAIDLHRVDGIHFSVAAFTNLTQDHLDYHHTIEEYFSVKKRLFTELDVDHRVVNIDDPMGAGMASELARCITVGLEADADVRATGLELTATGTRFELLTPAGDRSIELPLAGAFNVSNALVATGAAMALGLDVDAIVSGLEQAPQVPGRLERIEAEEGFSVYVDYAHTPDSVAKAARAVREVTDGRLILVVGAGGDRDPEKRPLMGQAAAEIADHVIITSDNPRSEDPVGIILQIEDGLRDGSASYSTEVDRRTAIAAAIDQATRRDAVLIVGKGHEDYQIFRERTIHFDDREVVREELARRC